MIIKVTNQKELNEALKEKDAEIELCGNGYFEINGSSQVTAYGSSQVTAYGSSQVRAYGSSQVTALDSSQVTALDSSQVTAYGSSQVTALESSQVTALDSSQVRAYGSSQVRALDSSQVTAYGSSQVRASKQVAVTKHGKNTKVTGGVQIDYTTATTVKQWLKDYDVTVEKGVAILYKGVGDDFKSQRGTFYTPGTTPSAPDWDGGKEECGGGLHFSPHPAFTLKYVPFAAKFVACPVKVSEIAVHAEAEYPDKVKAPRVFKPIWEVDINGNKVEGK